MSVTRARFQRSYVIAAAAAIALGAGGVVIAQDEAKGPVELADDSSGAFEVAGIDVDVAAKTADAARMGGFREAQRQGWKMLFARMTGKPITAAPGLSDSTLDGLVSGIVVEREQIGATRYIARLGVLFDRARAGQLLGVEGQVMRSPPMLTIPVLIDGGAAQTFETRTPWLKAWARFRAGASPIDYIRPTGAGADAQLLTYAQTERPNRDWWLNILDLYGAADVLVAEARLDREFPGGPVIGRFTARHGPDGLIIARFGLRTNAAAGLDAMLDEAVRRIDLAYVQALRDGRLKPDPSLKFEDVADVDLSAALSPEMPVAGTAGVEVSVETPDAAAVAAIENALRQVMGVSGTMITSLSVGSISRLQISYDGDFPMLRWALDQRGWRLDDEADGYRLRRRREGDPPIPRPAPPPPAPGAPAGSGQGGNAPQNLLPEMD